MQVSNGITPLGVIIASFKTNSHTAKPIKAASLFRGPS